MSDDVRIGDRVCLRLRDPVTGEREVRNGVWRVVAIAPANHDRPAVYTVEGCGEQAMIVTRMNLQRHEFEPVEAFHD